MHVHFQIPQDLVTQEVTKDKEGIFSQLANKVILHLVIQFPLRKDEKENVLNVSVPRRIL